MRNLNNLLYDLQKIHLIAEITHDEKGDIARYLPAETLDNISKEDLTTRLANLGSKLI